MKKYIILLGVIVFVNCNSKEKKPDFYSKKLASEFKVTVLHPGKKILESKCFVCHNPSTKHGERLAPPMIAVKAHYIDENTTKEEFMNEFIDFVLKPTKEKTKMRGAVRKFNVMPFQEFNKEEVEKIAEYVYDYKIEEPSWFKEHWEERKGKSYINEDKRNVK